jgi:hypothetical protein
MKRFLAAVAGLIALSPVAYAESAVIHISGYVPVICHSDFQSAQMQQGELIQLGSIKEFCNDGSGYQLIATHTAGDGLGVLILDGQTVPLDSSGRTILAQMPGPRAITQSLSYRPGTTTITTLSIEIRAASL